MGLIRVLPDHVANKIAAGEVVERPASVVKELIENALDAGARQIRIEVEAGGRKRIRLVDDGCGMVRDDALLAFERHATSKLRDADDLLSIPTLGFRGEALPAIAAVSRLTLETCPREGGMSAGTRVEISAGRLLKVSELGMPPGTAITVADLFHNIPARRKFLKSEATELGHIATLVTHYALAYPEVRFDLESEQRSLLAVAPVTGLAERLQQVFGAELLDQLVEVNDVVQWPQYDAPAVGQPPDEVESAAALAVYGFVSKPELQKLNRNSVFTFVNRRLVRDRQIQHAISEAYRNLLPSNTYPVVLLFLDLPFQEVDVNVHPSKVEVRFRRQGFVHDAVRDTVRRTLSASRPIPTFLGEVRARPSAGQAWRGEAAQAWQQQTRGIENGPPVALGATTMDSAPEFQLTAPLLPPWPQQLPFEASRPVLEATPVPVVRESGRGCGPSLDVVSAAPEVLDLTALRPLGQVRDSFIVAAGPTGLWLVDQHVAHERVLFEQVLEQRLGNRVEVQRLLMPLLVELDPGRWVRFQEIAEELQASGFEVEPFGQRTMTIKSCPAGVKPEQVQRLLEELLEVPEHAERETSLETIRTRIAATIACHAAIKVNMPLEASKMEWLLRALAQTRFPMTCPHGRPVLLHYGMGEIQRAFKRIK